MKNNIYIGVSYYPEHWSRERWPEDIRMMKEVGIRVVRLAELAWSFLEPEEGLYEFTWLDDFISLASKEGIQIVLGAPTEASPVWLRHKNPEVVRTNEAGQIQGGRGMHCHNSGAFIRYIERLVDQMAKHYSINSAVIGWQIDNELRSVECYCIECKQKFRMWLNDRYGSLEKLNEEWGTCFWSQIYNSWEEVTPPSSDQLTVSTSQILDFKRFSSDSTVQHLNRQVKIIKSHAEHQFVTHNTLGWYPMLDLYELSHELDFISWDTYPHVDSDNYETCITHDHHRALKQQPYWIMEQKNGYFNYSDYNLAIEPGMVRLWTYQDIARGANGVVYYRWRSNRYSVEQNPNGILRHDGTPRRVYDEIKQVTVELSRFADQLADSVVESSIAIIYSYDQIWAFDAHKQYKNFDYREHLLTYYTALTRMGLTTDLVDPMRDFAPYKLVIAPSFMMMNEDIYARLNSYVENGGRLIITARSGFKSWSNVTIDTPWPGLLSELAGVTVDEFEVLPDHYSNTITYRDQSYQVNVWLDMLETKTAESLAVYNEKFYAGKTAISKNHYRTGLVYYIGVMGNEQLISDVLWDITSECQLSPVFLPEGIFVTRRRNVKDCYTFYINMNRNSKKVYIEEEGFELISGQQLSGEVDLGGLDVWIVRRVA